MNPDDEQQLRFGFVVRACPYCLLMMWHQHLDADKLTVLPTE